MHDLPPISQAVQNGSVRLHAVDNMANRASGRRARIGRKAAIIMDKAASSATIQPSTVRPRIESRCPGAPGRVIRSLARARRRCRFQLGARLDEASRTLRRTASALCRCAGQAITDTPGHEDRNMRHGSGIWWFCQPAAPSAPEDRPRGARRNSSCQAVAYPQNVAHPPGRIEAIGNFTMLFIIILQ